MSETPNAAAASPSSGQGGADTGRQVPDIPSYDGDIAAMTAQIAHIDETVLPHLEMLRTQAERAGNGPRTLAEIDQAREAASGAREATTTALQAVRTANEAVHRAYADAAEEAAKDKEYLKAE